MNKEDMLKKLKGFIYSEFGTAKKYAEHKGVTPAFVSAVLNGNKSATEDMLSDIALKKSVTYFSA
jgi:plasmid maintenance system antidote protein VapI